MPNAWTDHVKAYAKKNNISYGCALTQASATYKYKGEAKKQSDAKTTKIKLPGIVLDLCMASSNS